MANSKADGPRRVFVVHGRDERARRALFDLLRAFDLSPVEWSEAVRSTDSAMPFNLEVLRSAFDSLAAVIVLLTPDDRGVLRHQFQDHLRDPAAESMLVGQPRLNVAFEAGVAWALFPTKTIFLERPKIKLFSDIDGVNRVRIGEGHEWKLDLARRLRTAGCEISDNGAWLREQGFQLSLEDSLARYESGGRQHVNLLDREELEDAQDSEGSLSADELAYCLVSSIQEGYEMAHWVSLNRSSRKAALLLAEFLVNSPIDHGRPRFRAGRALELFDDGPREEALNAAVSAGGPAAEAVNAELLQAVRQGRVDEFVRTTKYVKSDESREILLLELRTFPAKGTIRLVDLG